MSASAAAVADSCVSEIQKYKLAAKDVLTWKNTYVSGGVFSGIIGSLVLVHTVSITKLLFNLAYIAFGTAVAVEFAGRTIKKSPGFISSFVGKSGTYFTVQKTVVEPYFDGILTLINFGLVEVQQIIFVEDFKTTVAAFFSSYFVYHLIKFVSLYGLCFIVTITAFTAPLVYIKFEKEIDDALACANSAAEKQIDIAKAKVGAKADIAIQAVQAQVQVALDKVGYKRSSGIPPVPAPAATEPVAASPAATE
ncbi:putative reticulon-like protein RtnA [Limtongia smithiae]|uniref:putative reticulon-like protein RtnA n=1 Tax=Limtongia smithiae TaxID=1125753 RepID=UPI0034CDB8CD